ncbi:MAG TPA: hypothetical protein VMY87_04295 [Armatimonadota bacterium]|nr:hypothetical protein [Armatimonadota bacterium]
MKRLSMCMAMALLLVAAAGIAFAQQEARPPEASTPQLTADELAVLKQAGDLQKQLEISRLELRLAELKDASQAEIAERATQMYRLRGELHALRVKHPVIAQYQWRERGRHRWGRGRGRGRGGGPAWGEGGMGGGGRHGMGRGRGHGGYGWGEGPGMGRGRGHRGGAWEAAPGMDVGPERGMGRGGSRGMRMRESARDWLPPARNVDMSAAGVGFEQEIAN